MLGGGGCHLPCQDPFHQGAHAVAGGPFVVVPRILLCPHRAGYVQVGPGGFLHKLLKEKGGSDGGGGKGVKGTGISALMVGTGAGEGIGGMVGAGRGGWIAMVGVGKRIPGAIGGKPTSVPPVGTLGVCGGMIGPGTKLVALLSLDC